MADLEMKNHFGWMIDPRELQEYLDFNEELKEGIASIIQFLLADDEAINRRVQAGQQAPLRMDSPLQGVTRGVLLVIQAAIEGKSFSPAGDFYSVRPDKQKDHCERQDRKRKGANG